PQSIPLMTLQIALPVFRRVRHRAAVVMPPLGRVLVQPQERQQPGVVRLRANDDRSRLELANDVQTGGFAEVRQRVLGAIKARAHVGKRVDTVAAGARVSRFPTLSMHWWPTRPDSRNAFWRRKRKTSPGPTSYGPQTETRSRFPLSPPPPARRPRWLRVGVTATPRRGKLWPCCLPSCAGSPALQGGPRLPRQPRADRPFRQRLQQLVRLRLRQAFQQLHGAQPAQFLPGGRLFRRELVQQSFDPPSGFQGRPILQRLLQGGLGQVAELRQLRRRPLALGKVIAVQALDPPLEIGRAHV